MKRLMIFMLVFAGWHTSLWAEIVCICSPGIGQVKEVRKYYRDGILMAVRGFDKKGSIIQYDGEELNGEVHLYYPTETLKTTYTYEADKKNGPYRHYYENGNVHEEGNYVNGQLDGEIRRYYTDGTLQIVSTMDRGEGAGTAIRYDRQGNLLSQSESETDRQLEKMAITGTKVDTWKSGAQSCVHSALDKKTKHGQVLLFGSYGTAAFSMGKMNEYIHDWDEAYRQSGVPPMPAIRAGTMYGGGVEYILPTNVALGLEFELLEAKTVGGNSELGQELDVSALEWGGYVKFLRRSPDGMYGIGAGVYSVSLQHASLYVHQHAIGYYDWYQTMSGSALGMKIFCSGLVKITDVVGLGVDAGYRIAPVDNTYYTARENQKEPYTDYRGDRISIDYSGFFIRTGIRLILP